MKTWLDKQLGPPVIREPPVLTTGAPEHRRRLTGKQMVIDDGAKKSTLDAEMPEPKGSKATQPDDMEW